MSIDTIPFVNVNLLEVPAAGPQQVIFRVRHSDKADIEAAAKRLGMIQADFMRTVLLSAARKILSGEAKKAKPYSAMNPHAPPGIEE